MHWVEPSQSSQINWTVAVAAIDERFVILGLRFLQQPVQRSRAGEQIVRWAAEVPGVAKCFTPLCVGVIGNHQVDATLLEMIQQRPQRLSDLLQISGVGQAKLEKYGETFLAVIDAHR